METLNIPCDAPQRDNSPCPRKATGVHFYLGQPVFTCGKHHPEKYELHYLQKYAKQTTEAEAIQDPAWRTCIRRACLLASDSFRKQAEHHRERARQNDSTAHSYYERASKLAAKE